MANPRPFRFAVHTSAAPDGKAWTEAARRYEDLGFSTLLLRDHFDDQLGPIAAMTAAAAATSTLRVGCLVFDNDYRHPLVLAKELATIDVLSGGRVDVGIGAGWMAPDYEQAGMPFDPPGVRVSRMIEAVAVMKGLFADGPFSFSGEHYTITEHNGLPQPVQSPHPPIMIGGGGERMLRFAAREADIIGINPAKPRNDTWEDQNIGDATAEATDRKVGWIRESAAERFNDIELSIVAPFLLVTDDRVGLAESIAAGLDAPDGVSTGPDAVLSSPYVLVGTIDEMVNTLLERRDRWQLSYYVQRRLGRRDGPDRGAPRRALTSRGPRGSGLLRTDRTFARTLKHRLLRGANELAYGRTLRSLRSRPLRVRGERTARRAPGPLTLTE
jgi:probable F420-dependent oxidoreductase